jgi:hypothetical protein
MHMKNIRFAILAIAAGLFALAGLQAQTITGQGPKVKKELKLSSFQSIGLGVKGTVYLTKGPQKVTIEGQENIIDELEKDVENGSWNIGFGNYKKVRNYDELTIYISLPTVEKLSIGGSGAIIAKDAFEDLGELGLSIGGSGTIEFKGSADSAKISIAGSGDVRASELRAGSCKVSIAGSGDAAVEVNGELNVSIAGSGKVKYKGNPRIKTSVAGSGTVSSM